MRRVLLSMGLIALAAGLAGPAVAQTGYDLANHLLLKPGQWMIEEGRQLGNPQAPVSRGALVVTQQGPYILQNEFDWNGTGWVPGEVMVFEVTATHVVVHGWYHPITGHYGVFASPMRVPRYLKVHEPFTYGGVLVTGGGSLPITFLLEITADKITKAVKSGTYADCIRFKVTTVSNDTTETTSEILAPGHGRIASIEADLDETEPEARMLSAEIFERVDPKKP